MGNRQNKRSTKKSRKNGKQLSKKELELQGKTVEEEYGEHLSQEHSGGSAENSAEKHLGAEEQASQEQQRPEQEQQRPEELASPQQDRAERSASSEQERAEEQAYEEQVEGQVNGQDGDDVADDDLVGDGGTELHRVNETLVDGQTPKPSEPAASERANDVSDEPKRKRQRGPTRMKHIAKDPNQREHVDFTDMGEPCGSGSVLLSSYLGPLVREHVPFVIENWKKVGEDIKTVLWKSIQVIFVILSFMFSLTSYLTFVICFYLIFVSFHI